MTNIAHKTLRYIGLFAILLLGWSLEIMATHNRAGEITFEQIGDLTFRVTIATYTKTSSVPADRDSLELFWGDGTSEFVARNNGPNNNGQPLDNDIKYNTYVATHTYPGRGEYTLSMTDPNRNAGILNVNPPNSDQIPFYIQTTLTILQPFFQGYNQSPILLQPPIDIGYVNQIFMHNPNAYDPDGDSLAYELIIPSQAVGTPVTNYLPVTTIGGTSFDSLDPITGDYVWNTPQLAGEYNIAILIKEYRAGQLISTIVRDMQITIEPEQNRPPTIEPIDDICVVAGDTLIFDVIGDDPDVGQEIILSATGGPLEQAISPASFNAPLDYMSPVVVGQFVWRTDCHHARDQFYQMVFKAQDNFQGTQGGSTLRSVRIKVVAPPPEDVQAVVASSNVEVTWENPYLCDTIGPRFRGFSVWRRESSNPFEPDSCQTGLVGQGYTKIADTLTTLAPDGSGRYYFLDENVERAKFYCYRILGELADLNPANQPLKFFQSLPSEEACIQLNRDIPLITNVSVETTDDTNGDIFIRWSKPVAEDLDTIQNPGPYTYIVWRSEGQNGANLTQVTQFTTPNFYQANDTTFTDSGLATRTTAYSYEIEFLVNNGTSLGNSTTASSVFLSIASTDQTNILTWSENVPWENYLYTIYRYNETTSQFDSIGTATEQVYRDEGLENDQQYCYYVRSTGTYNIPNIIDPLINLSQESCGTPIDTVPPCPPVLTVTNDCDVTSPASVLFENRLSWTNPTETCPATNDTYQYNVYYAPNENAAFTLVTTITGANDTTYAHQLDLTIAGCYYVTAFDTLGNESEPSNIICKDNCPNYSLPNVFTPNNDGVNDVFLPFPYRFIDRVEMKIFNRWGGLVHETTDPDINWEGKNLQGKEVAEGVYYYTVKVYELVNDPNIPPFELEGYIQLIRGQP